MGFNEENRMTSAPDAPFWRRKTLEEMTEAEWESLCDGCGRCCLVKLEDEDTGEIHFTDVACRLFDAAACRCADYARRRRRVRDCVKLDPAQARALSWLPPTCAYRLVGAGADLPAWHPLVSGSPDSVHEAGISVRGRVAALETEVALDDYPDHIVKWPMRLPRGHTAVKGARKKAENAGKSARGERKRRDSPANDAQT
ncbi:YcgN family cysteine cluster protein [Methylocella sp.]|uniref:YcgN family cysteine cluster protein n=1 Tax=Methylocella sp. TaxID=1978226 RepID=UPI0035B39DDC